MTMTPEEIKNHIGEVWEDDDGRKWKLLAIDEDDVFFRILSDAGFDIGISCDNAEGWLHNNNLPQSLRKAKPRMVKAPGWVVWTYGQNGEWIVNSHRADEATARVRAELISSSWKHVAIQAPGSDEMEVVKGFER